ncbi:ATP-binding protein [Stenotrophomonas sp. 24(2023)]|uniref:ATP-binding protein n=1 Tax=Stenotrophomonas sp. 24(2023) TaxID=3068324 RepID=UPI0027E0E497|nr:ATP-binding protein [Stenotrophomonas sp. 24(2023)]WMJ69347.1 ATP-binding protein [Stenotrophomonas sp. 24(2023)]
MKPFSLRGRMLRALAIWVLLAWVLAVGVMYVLTSSRQDSNWDSKLEAMALRVLQSMPADAPAWPGGGGRLQARDGATPEDGLVVQVWRRDGTLLTASANAPQVPLRAGFGEGFASVPLHGREFRVYALSDRSGRYQVQVGNDRALIDADFQKHSVKAVSLAAIGMVLSGLMMWWSVRVALRPITSVQQALSARAAFDLTPLPEQALPAEIAPMVRAFNGVLRQLDDAIQAERNFLSDAAHELRTPLSALQTQLDVAMNAGTAEQRQRALEKAQLGVRRSSRLCEQLLDLARLDAGGRAPERHACALQDVVLHTVDEYAMAATLGGRRLDADVDGACVSGDQDELSILLRNLVDNALRHTPVGTRVRVRCGNEAVQGTTHAFLEVEDDGPGVPDAQHQRLFERFRRQPQALDVRGSGIGLALVARIAAQHGASIDTGCGPQKRGFRVRVVFPQPA